MTSIVHNYGERDFAGRREGSRTKPDAKSWARVIGQACCGAGSPGTRVGVRGSLTWMAWMLLHSKREYC
jgi:hypothetical protein